jgi:hypothetical protein
MEDTTQLEELNEQVIEAFRRGLLVGLSTDTRMTISTASRNDSRSTE